MAFRQADLNISLAGSGVRANADRILVDGLELHGLVEARNTLAQQTAVEPVAFIEHQVTAHRGVSVVTIAGESDPPHAVRPAFSYAGRQICHRRSAGRGIEALHVQ